MASATAVSLPRSPAVGTPLLPAMSLRAEAVAPLVMMEVLLSCSAGGGGPLPKSSQQSAISENLSEPTADG